MLENVNYVEFFGPNLYLVFYVVLYRVKYVKTEMLARCKFPL